VFRVHVVGAVPLLQPDVNGRTGILGRLSFYHCLSLLAPMDGTGRPTKATGAGISSLLFPDGTDLSFAAHLAAGSQSESQIPKTSKTYICK
jgi:hypothetical protein